MPYALLVVIVTSVAGVIGTVISGLGLFPMAESLRFHVVFALTGVTLALFAHSMTMFYFIGSAKKIKEFIASWEEETRVPLHQRTLATKRKLFPWMMLASLAVMAAFILGGAFDAGVVRRVVHQGFAYGATVVHVHTATLEILHIFRNIDLIREINEIALRRGSGES